VGQPCAIGSRRLTAIVSKSAVECPSETQEINEARNPGHTVPDRGLARTPQFALPVSPLLTRQCHPTSTLAVRASGAEQVARLGRPITDARKDVL
jgi:hypothetical protein